MAKVTGVDDLHGKLASIEMEARGKVLRSAMRSAMRPALQQARNTAPVGSVAHRTYRGRLVAPGFAKRSIKVVVTRDKGTGTFRAILGVIKEAFYAVHFWEYGAPAKGMPRDPWLSRSLEDNVQGVQAIFASIMRKRIEKIASKKGIK